MGFGLEGHRTWSMYHFLYDIWPKSAIYIYIHTYIYIRYFMALGRECWTLSGNRGLRVANRERKLVPGTLLIQTSFQRLHVAFWCIQPCLQTAT